MPKKSLHFAYATPFSILEKIVMRIAGRRVGRPSWNHLSWPSPVRAPLSITYHTARHLSRDYDVKLYDLRERVAIQPDEGDILLGHPWRDPKSIVWRGLETEGFEKRYIICPYN